MRVGRATLVSARIAEAGRGIGHGPPDLLEDRERATAARRIGAVGEQHDEQIAIGIDPQRRARPPRVPVAAGTEEGAGARYPLSRRQRLPAQGAGFGAPAEIRGLGGEEPYRLPPDQDTTVGERAAAQ